MSIIRMQFSQSSGEFKYLYGRMSSYSNQQIITSIKNGQDEVLFYLAKKYFQSGRRWLRRNGFRDADTPSVFSKILLKIYREIQQSNLSTDIDFEPFFFNSLRQYSSQFKPEKNKDIVPIPSMSDNEKEIIGSCYSILDESFRKILAARYVEKLSFEAIAVRHNFSNPVIAQFEFNKAFNQFEKIARARLNVASQ
jgi:DNA-directed RNA polymerase specialized sigma24 family protein